MAGNHFKGSDSGRPAVPPRPNGAGKAGTPGGAGQGGSGKRVSPGETAMFTALYEQSQKAKKDRPCKRKCLCGRCNLHVAAERGSFGTREQRGCCQRREWRRQR